MHNDPRVEVVGDLANELHFVQITGEQRGTEKEKEQREQEDIRVSPVHRSKCLFGVKFLEISYLLATSNNKNNSFSKPRAS